MNEVRKRQALANETGAPELVLGQFRFALRRRRMQGHVPFECADLRGLIDEDGSGGFVLELTARATFLASRPIEDALNLLFRIACAFGVVHESRLRRFDLAADRLFRDLAKATCQNCGYLFEADRTAAERQG